MTALAHRPWVPEHAERRVRAVAGAAAAATPTGLLAELDHLVEENRQIHDVDSINLNPATNIMNPRAEAMLSANLGSRPSLGYPGDKYEMGLEAIEQIEVIAAELVAEVFGARYAEIRVASGALANLYAFMATCEPGDTIIAPPATIGGHVTHHAGGSAGMYRLNTVPAPVSPDGYTVDVDALRTLAHEVKPKLITIGSSLNLYLHPVGSIRGIADEVGARVLFDAAHLCGLIAGKAWQQPLVEGADLISFSTYKSLGGPAGGAVVTNDPELAERLDKIAFPGLTANFDAGKAAALAVTMLDWKVAGEAYAAAMVDTAARLAAELEKAGLPLFAGSRGTTRSHQFAIRAQQWGGGQAAAKHLREANLLACGIGLPDSPVEGDVNGLRMGTPELVRLGMEPDDMADLAGLIARGLDRNGDPTAVAPDVAAWRKQFTGVHYTADRPS
ncbi:aminotransferase class I/II-fold pyridoxal phosphate-dependent enzyme [Saccharopolyspora sp. WRP15-2]|uniref:Aminotransferase class I/II-fold pyridoxal phosphate-dependent enzyme n=1 Tax=Saccharopolyspora oryzae TaxID=2997343 RepID=A0ABT4UWV6_9PSEU|nr:aminotransferase class I/II-fold pyridoxal phosphate-dependent enzyme [Saccharopolyspora oryzae]MDA3626202.1 aminotransferase class I/II-fold pyridoxal phosphate-dependent enzyme [Saccharopolyspora oryzae]